MFSRDEMGSEEGEGEGEEGEVTKTVIEIKRVKVAKRNVMTKQAPITPRKNSHDPTEVVRTKKLIKK